MRILRNGGSQLNRGKTSFVRMSLPYVYIMTRFLAYQIGIHYPPEIVIAYREWIRVEKKKK